MHRKNTHCLYDNVQFSLHLLGERVPEERVRAPRLPSQWHATWEHDRGHIRQGGHEQGRLAVLERVHVQTWWAVMWLEFIVKTLMLDKTLCLSDAWQSSLWTWNSFFIKENLHFRNIACVFYGFYKILKKPLVQHIVGFSDLSNGWRLKSMSLIIMQKKILFNNKLLLN